MKATVNLLALFLCSGLSWALHRQDIAGQWTVSGANDEIEIPEFNATVPGGVFTDLMRHGDINDIYYGTGDSNYSWVGLLDWTYKATFEIEEEVLSHSVVVIVCEGLDTFATISINGNEVGKTENMFVSYKFNIKDFLQVGSNELSVQFRSSVVEAAALAESPDNAHVIPPDCPATEYNGICHVNRIRKMQASFSWDSGPAFASVGIWKNIYLQAYDDGLIDYVVATPLKNPDRDVWTILVTTYFDTTATEAVLGRLDITLSLENTTKNTSVKVEQYLNEYYEILITTSLEVPAELLNLWWPNGYGTQDLYNLTVKYYGETESNEKVVKVGFRTVELVQEELEHGSSFYFKINNQPIFAKGANEIPLSILPESGQDPALVAKVLQTARDSHMNMLRVWGGGVYESDYFYDLADEYGILIWQDFMFACAMYPTDDSYLKNVRTEVRYQLKRLGSHPSIAIWAGNNENEGALRDDWYGTKDNFEVYKQDYIKLYVDLIESEVKRILRDQPFVTSSPSNGIETINEDYVANWPGDPQYGDIHFYDYEKDSWDVSTYYIPRFASEYGYQSMPSIESWLTATDDVADLHPDSEFLKYRQHHPDGNKQNVDLINIQLQLPDPSSENYTKTFIYFSQIFQAQAIKVQTEHYRSFKGRLDESGLGNTMGALYWQLNDVWVAPTWSGMDYLGRWKILQYFSQEFFNPMIVTGRLSNDNLEIYAILDGLSVPDVDVKAVVHIYHWDSLEPRVAVELPVTLDIEKSVPVTTISVSDALSTAGCGDDYSEAKKNCFFHLHLQDQDNNNLVPFNYVFPEKLKNCNLAQPNVAISTITPVGDDGLLFEIVITTDAVALFVWLDSHDIRGRFSENGFLDVASSKPVFFMADEATTVEDLSSVLTVTHLRDPAYL